MSPTILATKLFIPPPQKSLVVRPRLQKKLAAGLEPGCRLTLVSAPAGFGKTTLVSTWAKSFDRLQNAPSPLFAWFSLGEDDNDPLLFWSYVISALKSASQVIGDQALDLLEAGFPINPDGFLNSLLNDLARLPGPVILILDDYHLIRNLEIHRSISFLLENLPPQCHIILLSRTDPPLRLALLRSRGQLMEIRLADLRFSNAEAASYLQNGMNLSLPASAIDLLNTKTEGWAAGLQMAALSMQDNRDLVQFIHDFSGSNRYILDYLSDEILEHLPGDVQAFLLNTSILTRLCGPLCDVVTCGTHGQAILEQLEKANLFVIPLDNERHFYRYHHLFGEILRARLLQSNPGLVPVLLKRAAGWSEQNGQLEDAVFYLQAAKDDQGLAQLIDQNALACIKAESGPLLRKWVQLLPQKIIRSRPWLCILSAWWHASRAELAESAHLLDQAEELIRQQAPTDQTAEMLGTIYALRTEILHTQGDVAATIEMAHRALELLDPANQSSRASANYSLGWAYFASGDLVRAEQACNEFFSQPSKALNYRYYAIIATSRCGVLAIRGRLQQAINQYRQAIQHMQANGIEQFNLSGIVYQSLGMLLYQTNDLEAAGTLILEGLAHNRRWGNLNAICGGLIDLATLRIGQGDLIGAESAIDEVRQTLKGFSPYVEVSKSFLACKVHYSLAKGDIAGAVRLVEENGLANIDTLSFWDEADHMLMARILIAQDKVLPANDLLSRLSMSAEEGGRNGRLIDILKLRALALRALGKNIEAVNAVNKCLSLAAPEGYVRTFIDEGTRMANLLEWALPRLSNSEYASFLLTAFPKQPPRPAGILDNQKNNLALLEPLSRRELDVLQLIATGLSNKEISAKLSISLSTVKFHTTNIYAKLGVNERFHAAVKARELGLL